MPRPTPPAQQPPSIPPKRFVGAFTSPIKASAISYQLSAISYQLQLLSTRVSSSSSQPTAES
ncbi:MAG: hypothetical protein DMG02_28255 [Acidobacteria bacterium]|nr:MAG: hypothetical protein DMG02_28255 [Acidobacteriota bacterium]PYQ88990.1 MAG: hypothetical protein DMG03_02600 [Acidobacteriota bacterium]